MLYATREALIRLTNEIATERQGRLAQLQRELSVIEAEKVNIERAIHAARAEFRRSRNYDPLFGAQIRCPRCWIDAETTHPLTPKLSADQGEFWECERCGQSLSVKRSD